VDIQGSIAKRLGGAAGFTLVEMAVYVILSLAILTAAMTFIISGFHQQNTTASRTAASRTAEAGLQQLVRDLREAITSVSASTTSTTTSLSFNLPTPGNDTTGQAVTWTCTDNNASTNAVGTCTRALNGHTRTEIVGVQSVSLSPVSSTGASLALPLSAATNVAYIGITLQVKIVSQVNPNTLKLANSTNRGVSAVPTNTNPITVQAGADLQNFS
jgi:hypothetical protein